MMAEVVSLADAVDDRRYAQSTAKLGAMLVGFGPDQVAAYVARLVAAVPANLRTTIVAKILLADDGLDLPKLAEPVARSVEATIADGHDPVVLAETAVVLGGLLPTDQRRELVCALTKAFCIQQA